MQIARAFGASDIIAVDIQDEKLQKAKTIGATHTINSAKEDPIAKILVYAFLFCLNCLTSCCAASEIVVLAAI